jgi:ATP-dependent helicase YprA (DUF1998 family)
MDVFAIRDRIVRDYADYVRSFVRVRDERIRAHVDDELSRGLLWPEPLVQLNPYYELGASVDEIVDARRLHATCRQVFARKGLDGTRLPLRLYRHQEQAIAAAATDQSYVLTTGTGSGKSLAYIIPIVDAILRDPRPGCIQAIIVHPMNALANSQMEELDKFLQRGLDKPPVTYRLYTGQETPEEREEILLNPPDRDRLESAGTAQNTAPIGDDFAV